MWCHQCLQAFARLSAVYGGTYMLHKADAAVVYDESGRAVGVSSEGETAKCKFVVGDPSYFAGKTRPTSRVVRAVCILSHPIPSTDNAHSVQIILPQKQVGRRSGG
jgi:Rab GDP dissociation inhibitor